MAQKSDSALSSQADEIRDETTANANTATRVGTLFEDIVDSKMNNTLLIDEDNMATDSATRVPSQQSVKAYVDAEIAGVGGGTVTSVSGTSNRITSTGGATPVIDLSSVYTVDRATPSTAGATITLDMNSQIQRMHVGSASFATPKTIAMSNTTNSLLFNFFINVTDVAAVLTVPADWFMADLQFDGTEWTPPETGRYELGGSFDGTNWWVKIQGPFS